MSRAIHWPRDLSLIRRNDVRSTKFFHNQKEHIELQAREVTGYFPYPVHDNQQRYNEKRTIQPFFFFRRFCMALDVSSVLIAIFVISKGFRTVLAIKSVEFQEKVFNVTVYPIRLRWPVELRQYSIKPTRSRPTNSEPGVNSQCDSD